MRNAPADPAVPRSPRVLLRADFDRVPADTALWAPCDSGHPDHRDHLSARVRAVVAEALTRRQRDIVEWHFFEGLSQGEIARRLGVSQQIVQKALYGVTRGGRPVGGALRRLREALTRHP